MAEQQAAVEQYRCQKCQHDQATTALREVKVTVGWAHTEFLCVAPTHMCQRCGYVVVFTQVQIGQYLDLVPGTQARSKPQRVSTLQVVGREQKEPEAQQELPKEAPKGDPGGG